MGMFDSVVTTCPNCGDEVEFQSKAGDCRLRIFDVHSVPPQIAYDIDGQSVRCSCSELVTIHLSEPAKWKTMYVATASEADDGDEEEY